MRIDSAVAIIDKVIKEESKHGIQEVAWDVVKEALEKAPKEAEDSYDGLPCELHRLNKGLVCPNLASNLFKCPNQPCTIPLKHTKQRNKSGDIEIIPHERDRTSSKFKTYNEYMEWKEALYKEIKPDLDRNKRARIESHRKARNQRIEGKI